MIQPLKAEHSSLKPVDQDSFCKLAWQRVHFVSDAMSNQTVSGPAPSPESAEDDFYSQCANSSALACYDTTTSGDNIVSSFYINLIIGMLCLLGFIVWRGYFTIYFTKLALPGVSPRPPTMKLSGHHRIWSWLVPVFKINNEEFLRMSGFDAFVAVKIITYGVTLLIPMTILGVGVLLPVNYTYTDIGSDTSSVFYRMTISNIANKSPVLWLHFCMFILFVAWTCYLTLEYYKEHTAMRQTAMMQTAKAEIDLHKAAITEEPPRDTVSKTESPQLKSKLSEKGNLDVWPVRRLADEARSIPRPGRYTVVVRDERIHEFMTKPPKPLGLHHLMGPVGSKKTDIEMNRVVNSKPETNKELRMHVVADTFKDLYGDDFDRIIPIYRSKPVNKLLDNYQFLLMKIDRLELQLLQSSQKSHGKKEGQLRKLREQAGELAVEIEKCQCSLKTEGPAPCFIAVFKTQEAAAWALSSNPNPMHQRMLHILAGVDPENINWPTLERGWKQRAIRPAIVLIFILIIMLFPIGAITGIFAQLSIALCGDSSGETGSASGTWFCSDDPWATFFRNIITGWLPSILMSVYQAVVLPVAFYSCAQAESQHISLSGIDLRIASLFFYWNMFNFFVGALLGGSAASGIRAAINDPGDLPAIIAGAASAASNFFINYVIQRALMMTFFRLFWPNASMTMYLFRFFHIFPKPKTERDKDFENPPRNCRFGRDIGVSLMAVYICTLGYCVVSPFILPCALLYFLIIAAVWKYQMLYVFVPAYDSKGQMWPYFAHRIVACLGLCTVFTASIFAVKQAYVQAGLSFILVGIALLVFDKHLSNSYDVVFAEVPTSILRSAPRVEIDQEWYVPPGLRPGAKGYYFESGKAWQGWGAPRHGP